MGAMAASCGFMKIEAMRARPRTASAAVRPVPARGLRRARTYDGQGRSRRMMDSIVSAGQGVYRTVKA